MNERGIVCVLTVFAEGLLILDVQICEYHSNIAEADIISRMSVHTSKIQPILLEDETQAWGGSF